MRSSAVRRAARALPILAIAAGCTTTSPQAMTDAGSQRDGILAAMDSSAAGWNAGKLDTFMAIYLDAARTSFVTRDSIIHGKQTIAAHYAPRFAAGAPGDSLSFERLEIDSLAPDLAYLGAYYVLQRGDSITARGPTTLVMQRVNGRWYIVHDHSS
ncbi:MAG TPA: nuclear transport factor 2 family protein [Gemmatimonadaceae bacterium]|nr:nuclear transport factor 2 family protein [Gemmatimonadaceae bacterium]